MEISDQNEQIEAIIARKREARLAFFQAHRDGLYATACHMLGNDAPEAQGIVLEAIDWGFMHMRDYKAMAHKPSLADWLNQHVVVGTLRAINAREKKLESLDEEIREINLPANVSNPGDKRADMIRRATKQQSDEYYDLLTSIETDGKSHAEMCRVKRKPLGELLNMLMDAKQNIKARVEKSAAEL